MISRRSSLRLIASSLGMAGVGGDVLRALGQGDAPVASPVVETAQGRVRGTTRAGVHVFKGIRYGASPAGRGRFRPPVPPAAWSGVSDVTAYGPRAAQPVRVMIPELGDSLTGSGPISEDCLRVNIWTGGLSRTDRRPVMVFLHGGGFQTGSGNSVVYDGDALARNHGAVVVTLTHRLNAFGYLYLAELGGREYAGSGAAGLLDIVAALEWVRENIGGFGGDPGCVTLFGESGGAAKTCMVMAMPRARGLFHRAIVQSTMVNMAIRGLSRAEGTALAERLLARLSIDARRVDLLHDVPMERLIAAQEAANGPRAAGDTGGYFANAIYPVIDGELLPAHPFDPVAPAPARDVPFMCGSNEHEVTPYMDASLFTPLDDAALLARVSGALRVEPGTGREVIALYRRRRPAVSNLELATIIMSDNSVLRTAQFTMAERKVAQGGAPVYMYYFQWPSPVRGGVLGAMHAVELPFVFQNTGTIPEMVGRGQELEGIAAAMSAAWVAFARTGSPSTGALPWPAFTAGTRATMVFSAQSGVVNDPYGDERRRLLAIREAQAGLPAFQVPGCPSVACASR